MLHHAVLRTTKTVVILIQIPFIPGFRDSDHLKCLAVAGLLTRHFLTLTVLFDITPRLVTKFSLKMTKALP